MFGTHNWQLWCGNGWVPTHVSVHCMQFCSDTCSTAGNGICEDGGPHSSADTCYYGTDCTDCRPRDTAPQRPCIETEDEHGFTCGQYVLAGYTCFEMTNREILPRRRAVRCSPWPIIVSDFGRCFNACHMQIFTRTAAARARAEMWGTDRRGNAFSGTAQRYVPDRVVDQLPHGSTSAGDS